MRTTLSSSEESALEESRRCCCWLRPSREREREREFFEARERECALLIFLIVARLFDPRSLAHSSIFSLAPFEKGPLLLGSQLYTAPPRSSPARATESEWREKARDLLKKREIICHFPTTNAHSLSRPPPLPLSPPLSPPFSKQKQKCSARASPPPRLPLPLLPPPPQFRFPWSSPPPTTTTSSTRRGPTRRRGRAPEEARPRPWRPTLPPRPRTPTTRPSGSCGRWCTAAGSPTRGGAGSWPRRCSRPRRPRREGRRGEASGRGTSRTWKRQVFFFLSPALFSPISLSCSLPLPLPLSLSLALSPFPSSSLSLTHPPPSLTLRDSQKKKKNIQVGAWKTGDLVQARKLLSGILAATPASRQAGALKTAVDDQIVRDGLVGIGIGAAALAALGCVLAMAFGSRR